MATASVDSLSAHILPNPQPLPNPPPKPPNPSSNYLDSNVDDHGVEKVNPLVTDFGSEKDDGNIDLKTCATLKPFIPPILEEQFLVSSIVFVEALPLSFSYDIIHKEFSTFGPIKEIRNRLSYQAQFWEMWIVFYNAEDASRASVEYTSDIGIRCSLVQEYPSNLDIYIPPKVQADSPPTLSDMMRQPKPPRWLIVTTREDRGNLIKVRKFLTHKIGSVNRQDISRFGRNSFLVHAKSDAQSVMLSNLNLESGSMLKQVKPHYNFSYVKGVIFNEDVYDFSTDEILEMCPDYVYKVFKVPNSRMIILTFESDTFHPEVIIESLVTRVRPFKPSPLQCFNCFGFGHSSRVCTLPKICGVCCEPEHEDPDICNNVASCKNCKENHPSRFKKCKIFLKEQEAVIKAQDEHISVGYAKKLLNRPSYSDKLKSTVSGDVMKKSKPVSSGSGSRQVITSSRKNLPDLELGIMTASQASSGESSQPLHSGVPRAPAGGAPQASSEAIPASIEASQACSLPDLGVPPMANMLTHVPLVVEVHESSVGSGAVRVKKRARPPSPPQSPNKLLSNLSKSSSSLDRQKENRNKRREISSSGKPSLSRPLKK